MCELDHVIIDVAASSLCCGEWPCLSGPQGENKKVKDRGPATLQGHEREEAGAGPGQAGLCSCR